MAKRESHSSEADTDMVLVDKVREGDNRAFDLLVRKYQNRIIKLISRYVRDPSEALDVAQETFLKAYRAIPRFRGDSAFYTWLYRIAINTAKNHLAAQIRRPLDASIETDDDDGFDLTSQLQDLDSPDQVLLKEEVERTVVEAVENLPDDLRAAITLRELEGLSYEEIAEAMGCPIGTVRSRIFRAREAIDNKLKGLQYLDRP